MTVEDTNPYIAALDRLTAEMARLADAEEKRNELLMTPWEERVEMREDEGGEDEGTRPAQDQ